METQLELRAQEIRRWTPDAQRRCLRRCCCVDQSSAASVAALQSRLMCRSCCVSGICTQEQRSRGRAGLSNCAPCSQWSPTRMHNERRVGAQSSETAQLIAMPRLPLQLSGSTRRCESEIAFKLWQLKS